MPVLLNAQSVSAVAKLVNTPRTLNNSFGQAVAIYGDYAVVGTSADATDAAGTNPLSEAGAAFIFRKTGGVWSLQQKIVAADRAASDYFGSAVAIHGNWIVVGAQKQDGDAGGANPVENAGAAYVFHRDSVTGMWSQQQKVTAPASFRATGDCFGYSVGITDDAVVAGAYLDNEDGGAMGNSTAADAGAAYVFRRNGSAWNFEQKLVAADRQPGDLFGFSVSIFGDDVLVGARLSDLNAAGVAPVSNAGAAYVFHRIGAGMWTQQQKLVASDRAANDAAGYAVAIHGDYAVIGAPQEDEDAAGSATMSNAGSAYIFHRNGGVWTQAQKIVAVDRAAGDRLGLSAAIAEDRLLLGAPGADAPGNSDAGAAYVFKKISGAWVQDGKAEASDRQGFDEGGKSVAMWEGDLMIGAATSNLDAGGANPVENAGAAYLYAVSAPLSISGIRISATNEGMMNRVTWQEVGEESAGTEYVLERSADGLQFVVIDVRDGDEMGLPYFHDDKSLHAGTNYYRVRATDASGRVVVSGVASALMGRSNDFSIRVYPSPVTANTSNLTVRVQGSEAGSAELTMVSAAGKVLRYSALGGAEVQFDISALPAGLYLVRYTDGARTETVKVTKQ